MSSYKRIKTDLFTIEPYDWQPCETKVFRIKGVGSGPIGFKAEKTDFGIMEDVKSAKAEPFACKCMKFIPDRTPQVGVLEKYGITRKQWTEIKNALKEALFVGECGCCV